MSYLAGPWKFALGPVWIGGKKLPVVPVVHFSLELTKSGLRYSGVAKIPGGSDENVSFIFLPSIASKVYESDKFTTSHYSWGLSYASMSFSRGFNTIESVKSAVSNLRKGEWSAFT